MGFQDLARPEREDPTGRDLDVVAGLGIAPHPRFPVADAEGPEAREGQLLALLKALRDRIQKRIDRRFRLPFPDLRLRANGLDQFRLRHLPNLP